MDERPSPERQGVPAALAAYHAERPDPGVPAERVAFGTSGHRGTSLKRTFNEDHVAAVCQAIVEYRREQGIRGPLFLGGDTHALSGPALETALEVFAANEVQVRTDRADRPVPTPAISHAILVHNRGAGARADGVVVTPSHNPPEDGGIKYNPPGGGPADTDVTRWIEERANRILEGRLREVQRIPARRAFQAATTARVDYVGRYAEDLPAVVDVEAIARAGLSVGIDPMGGASLPYWERISDRYGLRLEIVNRVIDPAFAFMPPDWDGRIRMDCSSPAAMAHLLAQKDRFHLAVGNDPDADRHGIVTRGGGLMNPNHYLAVAAAYLFRTRERWGPEVGLGKTLVSSAMLDRVAESMGRRLYEVPVGFKWFAEGLHDGWLGFAGEESAGASFLCRDGTAWSTDKDGILLGLLAAEIRATTGRDPAEHYAELEARFGSPAYVRVDAPATAERKRVLARLNAGDVRAGTLGGDPITRVLTTAPGNGAAIGGLKVVTERGWVAMRPSGTEDVYKIYAESFGGPDHLKLLLAEARALLDEVFRDVVG